MILKQVDNLNLTRNEMEKEPRNKKSVNFNQVFDLFITCSCVIVIYKFNL